jgi:hypothetical protein
VTKASNDKWQRYEQALLVAMQFDLFSSSATTTDYQLLILPAFHPPCCLRLVLAEQEGELSFSLLMDHFANLLDAIWREDAQAEGLAVRLARRSCLEDITGLNAEQVATFRRQLAALEPMTLGDVDLAARDGVSIRCDCSEQNRHHTFSMRSPTVQEAPRHAGLISVFLDATQAHFHSVQLQDYLGGIRSYFH